MFNEPFYQEDYDPDLPGFLEKVQEAVETEVDRRLHEEIADVDKLREDRNDYNAAIIKAESEVREANRKMHSMEWEMGLLKEKCRQEVEAAKLNGFENALGKWATAESAYVIDSEEHRLMCPICGGNRRIPVDAGGIKAYAHCPLCNSGGSSSMHNIPEKRVYTVNRISLKYNPPYATKRNGQLKILIKEYSHEYVLGDLAFTARTPADEYAEKKNKEEELRAEKVLNETIKKMGLEKYLKEET